MAQAIELARRCDFSGSCTLEVGRLLRVRASQHRRGTVGAIGTGCGVGAAWIIAGLASTVEFVTGGTGGCVGWRRRSTVFRLLKRDDLPGDWTRLHERAPIVMLFADPFAAKNADPTVLLEMMCPGGMVVMDNLTPEHLWTAEQRAQFSGVIRYGGFGLVITG